MSTYFLTPPRNIVRIQAPITTSLQFESTFTVDEDTQKEFKKISEIREKALQAASRSYTASSISAITEYLPLLIGLMNAAEALPPDFSRYLRISWNSALTPGFYRENLYSHYNWYYELYGLTKRALAHDNLNNPNFDDSENLSKETSLLLREAAGIFDFIHDHICKKFAIPLADIKESDHFPELFADTYKMLSYISIAECQQIGLKKTVLTNKKISSPEENKTVNNKNKSNLPTPMSPLSLAKLAEGIVSNYEKASLIMEKMTTRKNNGILGGNLSSCINLNLVKYVDVSRQIFRGISYHFVGLHYKKEFDYSKQCAYLEQSKTIFNSIKYDTVLNQEGKDIIEGMAKEMKPILEIAEQVHKESLTQNSFLFQHKEEKVEVVPVEAKILVEPVVFVLPDPLKIEIKQRNSLWCCIQ